MHIISVKMLTVPTSFWTNRIISKPGCHCFFVFFLQLLKFTNIPCSQAWILIPHTATREHVNQAGVRDRSSGLRVKSDISMWRNYGEMTVWDDRESLRLLPVCTFQQQGFDNVNNMSELDVAISSKGDKFSRSPKADPYWTQKYDYYLFLFVSFYPRAWCFLHVMK